jgi:hypothetical protein
MREGERERHREREKESKIQIHNNKKICPAFNKKILCRLRLWMVRLLVCHV